LNSNATALALIREQDSQSKQSAERATMNDVHMKWIVHIFHYCDLVLKDTSSGLQYGFTDFLLARRGHTDHGRGNAEGRDYWLAGRLDGGAIANAAEDGLFAVTCDAGLADFAEFLEESGSVRNGVIGTPG